MCFSDWFRENDVKLVFLVALLARLVVYRWIPVDWNSDSYHHWLISYLTLHIGLGEGRLWDLLGCDYYWGMFYKKCGFTSVFVDFFLFFRQFLLSLLRFEVLISIDI